MEFYSVQDVADQLGTSKTAVRRLHALGKLTANITADDGSPRFSRADLAAYSLLTRTDGDSKLPAIKRSSGWFKSQDLPDEWLMREKIKAALPEKMPVDDKFRPVEDRIAVNIDASRAEVEGYAAQKLRDFAKSHLDRVSTHQERLTSGTAADRLYQSPERFKEAADYAWKTWLAWSVSVTQQYPYDPELNNPEGRPQSPYSITGYVTGERLGLDRTAVMKLAF